MTVVSVNAKTFKRLERDPEFHLKVIVGDEMCFYGCDQETKQHLLERKSSSSILGPHI